MYPMAQNSESKILKMNDCLKLRNCQSLAIPRGRDEAAQAKAGPCPPGGARAVPGGADRPPGGARAAPGGAGEMAAPRGPRARWAVPSHRSLGARGRRRIDRSIDRPCTAAPSAPAWPGSSTSRTRRR